MKGSLVYRTTAVLVLLLIAVLITSVSCGQKEPAGERIGVVVSILPLADFVENVGGERVAVSVMVPPGASPHAYEPTPSQMVALTRAKLYVQVGSGIEFELSWMDKLIAVNEEMLVVDSSKGAKVIEVAGEDAHEREGAVEPHIWLSPLNAKVMVQNIYESLVQVDSVNKSYYEQNRDAYLQRLTELDQDISNDLSGVTNRSFMVYHPAFVYFSEAYNLTIFSIEAAGKEPTAAGLVYLIEQAREHNIKVILASPQFNPQSSEVIAKAIDGTVAFVDPLARGYIRNMRLVLSEMVSAME